MSGRSHDQWGSSTTLYLQLDTLFSNGAVPRGSFQGSALKQEPLARVLLQPLALPPSDIPVSIEPRGPRQQPQQVDCSVTEGGRGKPGGKKRSAVLACATDQAAEQEKAAKHQSRQSHGVETQLQQLLLEQQEQQAVNIRLKHNLSFLLDWQQQQEVDHHVLDIVHRSPSPPVPLPASCSQVSFSVLPHASLWDAAWVARVRALSAQDLLVLRRQWLHQSSLLLPAAEHRGPGSAAYEQLVSLHSRHISLVQSALSLMPETWLQMSEYNMETLQPIATPEPSWLSSMFKQTFPKDLIEAAVSISRDYDAQSQQLKAQLLVLLRQHQILVGASPGHMAAYATGHSSLPAGYRKLAEAGSSSSGSKPTLEPQLCHPSGAVSSEDDVITELNSVTQLIKANTGKQLVLLKQFLCRMQHSRRPPENVRLALLMYPLALNALDLSRGLVLGAEASPRTLSKDPQHSVHRAV